MAKNKNAKSNPYAPPAEMNSRRGGREYATRTVSPTVVEIVVMCGIVAILVGMLLPAVFHGRRRAAKLPEAAASVPATSGTSNVFQREKPIEINRQLHVD